MNPLWRMFLFIIIGSFFQFTPQSSWGASYAIQKVHDGVYAAVAQPGGKAASNALIVIGKSQVVLAGAHFVVECINELTREISKLTPLPLRTVILTHHHKGFSFVDFDFPSNVELVMSWQTWQALKGERRELKNNISFFSSGLTLVRDANTMVLTNTEFGHTTGDVIVFLSSAGILFTSDLLYNEAVGYMGDGNMRDWVTNLELLEDIGAHTIIPGIGMPGPSALITEFKEFFREFLTEIIRLKSEGRTLAQAKKEFTIAAKFKKLAGYNSFISSNIERAYADPEIQ
jgi:cyclase